MMETHPVDLRADVLVDRQVRASGELLVVREPRRERRVREDELARRGLARLGALERDRVVPAAEYAVSV